MHSQSSHKNQQRSNLVFTQQNIAEMQISAVLLEENLNIKSAMIRKCNLQAGGVHISILEHPLSRA